MHIAQATEDRGDFLLRENDREVRGRARALDVFEPGQVAFQHVPVKKRIELLARFWVDDATLCSTARFVRNASTSGAPSVSGWRLP